MARGLHPLTPLCGYHLHTPETDTPAARLYLFQGSNLRLQPTHFGAENRLLQGFSRTFSGADEYFILSPAIPGSKCVGTGKEKTPDASGHMAAAPGISLAYYAT